MRKNASKGVNLAWWEWLVWNHRHIGVLKEMTSTHFNRNNTVWPQHRVITVVVDETLAKEGSEEFDWSEESGWDCDRPPADEANGDCPSSIESAWIGTIPHRDETEDTSVVEQRFTVPDDETKLSTWHWRWRVIHINGGDEINDVRLGWTKRLHTAPMARRLTSSLNSSTMSL